ncbi:hypothetical protein B0I35DRAFT_459366 [Stachybotrys elegans]|uniref:Peptidase A1 domain-containing protein n=1 Tax=Stachybotrys elegans TaxID=80388 RepID=A0A8K0WTW9_9HYPO|nr:hypothetical protein B0I35DRAFT_459366 [Stachybotrys elegans]
MVAPTPSIVSPALLLATFIASAYAQRDVEAAHYNLEENHTVRIPEDRWEQAIRNANATATVRNVTGYNTTQAFPGTPMDGWSLSVSVIGDYAVPRTPYDGVTGAQVLYEEPRSILNQTDQRWPMGLEDGAWSLSGNIYLVDYPLDESFNQDCRGVLSDECWEALHNITQTGETRDDPRRRVCEGELSNGLLAFGGGAIPFSEPIGVNVFRPGDVSLYDDMISKVWLVHFGFGARDPSETHIPDLLTCLRPEARSGSRDIEDVIESAAPRATISLAWGGLVSAGLMFAAML